MSSSRVLIAVMLAFAIILMAFSAKASSTSEDDGLNQDIYQYDQDPYQDESSQDNPDDSSNGEENLRELATEPTEPVDQDHPVEENYNQDEGNSDAEQV